MPFAPVLSSCGTDVPRTCCIPNGAAGSPCTAACGPGLACFAEAAGFPAGGLCSSTCDDGTPCAAGLACLPSPLVQAPGICLPRCTSDETCRAGWSCQPMAASRGVSGGATVNACWNATGVFQRALGKACGADVDCLSGLCLAGSDGTSRCASPCDAAGGCLPGYACRAGFCTSM